MILAAARVMFLNLRRDPTALVLTFALPPLIFILLAAIFAGATGTELRLHVGVLDLSNSTAGARLEQGSGRPVDIPGLSSEGRRGVAAGGGSRRGLHGRPADPERPFGRSGTRSHRGAARRDRDADPPAAGAIVAGQVLRTLNEKLPDVALTRIIGDVERAGKIDADERAFLENAFSEEVSKGGEGFAFSRLVEQRDVDSDRVAGGPVGLLCRGRVAAIFLLFAAMQGAATLLEERQAGIFARLVAGRHGLAPLLAGKFLFLTAQGMVQVALIQVAAAVLYRVDALVHPPALACHLSGRQCHGGGRRPRRERRMLDAAAGAPRRELRGADRVGGRRQHGSPLPDAALAAGPQPPHAERRGGRGAGSNTQE